MKKIFTKLTLFALALVGGTQMVTARELEGTNLLMGNSLYATSDNGLKNVEFSSTAKQYYFGDEDSEAEAFVQFTVKIPANNVLQSATLYWDHNQYGRTKARTTVVCSEITSDTEWQPSWQSCFITGEYSGWGSNPQTFRNLEGDVTSALKNIIGSEAKNEEQTVNIVFKFTANAKSALLVEEFKNGVGGLPALSVVTTENKEICYTVSYCYIDDKGNLKEFQKDDTRTVIGVGSYAEIKAEDTDPIETDLKVGDNETYIIRYVYNGNSNMNVPIIQPTSYSDPYTEKQNNKLVVVFKKDQILNFSLKFNRYEYLTYCNFEVNLDYTNNPQVEAYRATLDKTGKYIHLDRVYDVPKGMPVILKSITADNAEKTVNVVVKERSSYSIDAYDNILKAEQNDISARNLMQKAVSGQSVYVLFADGFTKLAGKVEGTLEKGRAYLVLDDLEAENAGARISIVENDEATAVAEVEAQATGTENVIYNMQGVRVQNATAPGLYIINGKKVLVK